MSDAANFRLLGAKQMAKGPALQVAGPSEKDTGTAEMIGSTAGSILGTIVGAYFGGPAGASLGGAAGRKAGGGLGKIVGGGDVEEGLEDAFVPDASTLTAAANFAAAKAAQSSAAGKK